MVFSSFCFYSSHQTGCNSVALLLYFLIDFWWLTPCKISRWWSCLISSKNVFLRKKIKVPREVLKYHGSWHVCTKQSEHFRKGNVGNSYALRARHYQISHADIELLKFSFFNSCAWLRYNLLSFLLNQLHAIPYVISDLKKEVTHPFFSFPWISLLNIYATSFATTRIVVSPFALLLMKDRNETKQPSANIFLIYVQLCCRAK